MNTLVRRCTFRVWAPHAKSVHLVLYDEAERPHAHPMQIEPLGFFSLAREGIVDGQRYAFQLNNGQPRPDPVSHWQPGGVHAASAVVRLESFPWTDVAWRGVPPGDLVIYELHVGTFTAEGTFDAVIPRLPELKELGITAIEIMPVAQFPGMRDWGYDGVNLYAVQHSYGGPRGLQRLVDAAHGVGLAVILDVVYNHLGPEGNYLREFGPYFSDRHHTPWGAAVNYDDRGCDAVRAWVLHNVRMWIRDFHMDGLRLDAVQTIFDSSPRHILAQIADAAQDEAQAAQRIVHVIAESDQNDVRLVLPHERGGHALSAMWSDDFHHAVHALLTGERNGYFADYAPGGPQIGKALCDVFVFDGAYSPTRGRSYGACAEDMPADRFVVCVQNHDQVGNHAAGNRLASLVEPAKLRLAAGLMLLSPYTPLLFMGEEYGEQRPFPFFCNFNDKGLQDAVRRGRREHFEWFGWTGTMPDPVAIPTWASAKLGWSWPEGSWNDGLRLLYRTLLQARRNWPELRSGREETEVTMPGGEVRWLCLTRRRRDLPGSAVAAYFNLSDEAVDLAIETGPARTLLLRSEDPEFGGRATRLMSQRTLLPWEFAVHRIASS